MLLLLWARTQSSMHRRVLLSAPIVDNRPSSSCSRNGPPSLRSSYDPGLSGFMENCSTAIASTNVGIKARADESLHAISGPVKG